MYKVSVPIVRYYENIEENIRQLRRLGAERVFLCPSIRLGTDEETKRETDVLARCIPRYREAGFEVGVWINSIGHGGDLVGMAGGTHEGWTNIRGIQGRSPSDSFCPLDENFANTICRNVRMIAACKPDMIQLDDDYRLSTRAGDSGCACKLHMAEFCRRLGETITHEELIEKVFLGEPNRYRKVWYDLQGDTLRDFARKIRAAADEVDPSIPMSACACLTTWDEDGTDSIEISRILAGSSGKPFLRFIGAPYHAVTWGLPNSNLGFTVEMNRMQAHWCENTGIEIFTEGDVYPRPRSYTPASYLENFDTMLRAAGCVDGILKYGIDYNASPVYETGYADRAERNRPDYAAIERMFGDKTAVGVNVACQMKTFMGRVIRDRRELHGEYTEELHQQEQELLVNASVPITYGDAGVRTVFGENARYIDLPVSGGLLLDTAAAEILQARGFDAGLLTAEPVRTLTEEFFPADNERLTAVESAGLYALTAADGAEMLQEYRTPEPRVGAYRYENKDGVRVCVLGCNAKQAKYNRRYMQNYCRQRMIASALTWLNRGPLPAVCTGHPNLYILCKKGADGSMAVGLWNNFADEVFAPTVTLDGDYEAVSFLRCAGKTEGDRFVFETDIPAFGFAAFEVKPK